MRFRTRDFAFFALGGIVFLLGSLFTPFQGKRVDAQVPFQEWIRCGTLEILDETGHPIIFLGNEKDGGGIVNIFGKGGWASLSANKNGGAAVVSGGSGEGRLTVDENGARFTIQGEGKGTAEISADEHGGFVSISNKTAQEVGAFRVSKEGGGVLETRNQQGR